MATDLLTVALSYLLVLSTIVLFMAPFFWWYRREHYEKEQPQISFNRQLENFFMSRQANYLIFCWAMGEAIFWYVIPEFLLLLVVFMRVRRKHQLLSYDIYGTVAGSLLALMIRTPASVFDRLPFLQPAMITQTQHWFDQLGVWGLLHQPFSGIPYKVFLYVAHDYQFFIPLFLVVAIAARVARYAIAYLALTLIYPPLHKYVYNNYVRLFLLVVFVFTILLLRVYNIYNDQYQVTFVSWLC